MEEHNRNRKRIGLVAVIVAVLLLSLLLGGVVAKYISTNRRQTELMSSDFHFSSDYLAATSVGDPKPTYPVFEENKIQIELYNYQKENVDLIAAEEIQYRVQVDDTWVITITDDTGTEVKPNPDGSYTMPKSETGRTWTLSLTGGDVSKPVQVAVETVQPYRLKLEGEFRMDRQDPNYTVEDMGNYRVLTIQTNDYAGPITVNWPKGISPDNTNPLMTEWADAEPSGVGVFQVEKNHSYTLMFVENTEGNHSVQKGTGNTITIKE